MGSCEKLTSVDDPSGEPVSGQHVCSEFTKEPVSEQGFGIETSSNGVDANVSSTVRLDECMGLSSDDAMHCVGSVDVGDTGIGREDGLNNECQNVVGVGLEKVFDDERGISRVCFNESQGETGVCTSPDRSLGLSRVGNNICVSSANVTEAVAGGDRDGSAGECENVACSVMEKLEDDKKGFCLNESQSEEDVCCGETNVLSLEKIGCQGEHLESFENSKLPLGEISKNSSLRFCDQQAKQKDDQEVNLSSLKETVEVMEEQTNVLAEVEVDNDRQNLSSDTFGGMSLGSIPMTGLPTNCVQQHRQKGYNIVSCCSGEAGIMLEKSDDLAELEKDSYGQIVPSRSFEIPSDLKHVTGLPCCAQLDEQKEERIVSCPSLEGDIKGMEEKTDSLDGIEKVSCDQILASQFCEMPSELLPLAGSPRNSAQQDDQENDNNVGCSASKGVMESINEKTDALAGMVKVACDQIIPSQCCEISSEVVSRIGSSRNCVQLGDQKNDNNDGSPTSEALKEVIEEKMGTCGLLSRGSLPPEFTPMADSLRNCTKLNVQKGDEGSCIPSSEEVVEEKHDALMGVQIDISARMLSLQECEVPSESTPVDKEQFIIEEKREFVGGIEHDICDPSSPTEHFEFPTELASSTGFSSSCTLQNEWKGTESLQDSETPFKVSCDDDLMRICEGHKRQMDHESVCLLAVGTMEPKGNTDACILSLPVQNCHGSLESSHIADSLSNSSHQNEQGNNRSVDGLSAGSVAEVVEEKSDVTTDAKVEGYSHLSPLEEILEEQSSRVAPNSFIKEPALQSCQPSVVGMTGSCKSLDHTDLSQKDCFGDISSNNAVGGSGHTDLEEKFDAGLNCFSETKYANIISSFSRWSRLNRSSQKTQTKRATRNCRTKAKLQYSRGNIDIIFNVARRKRSCLFKPARSSTWGLPGSINRSFGNSDVSSFSLAQNQGSQKARGGNGSQKQDKIRVGGNSSRSSRKCNVSTRCIRLKVKVGKEICRSTLNVVVPDGVDTTGSDDIVVDDDKTDSYPAKNSEFPQLAHEVEDLLGEEGTERQLQCPLANQDLKATVIMDKSAGDAADDHPTHKMVEVLGGAIENNYLDPGTSPDSEVINVGPDAEIRSGSQDGWPRIVLTSSETLAAPGNVNSSKRGKKTNILCASITSLENSSPVAASMSKAKPPKKRGGRQKLEDVSQSGDSLFAFLGANPSSHSSSGEPLLSSREVEPGMIGDDMVPSIKSKGCALSKNLKSDGRKKGRFKVSNSTKSRRKNASTQQGNQRKSVKKNKVKEKSVSAAERKDKGAFGPVEHKTEDQQQIGSHIADDIGKTVSGDNSVSVDAANVAIISAGEPEHNCSPESAWVQCDGCYKWRRIPVSLANSIDENCRWVCKDNMDTTFADCLIPQEKTNEDINAELGLSDFEEEGLLNYNRSGKVLESQRIAALPGSSFRRIDSNVFLHRTRKTQTIDEVMVCHCKPPSDGRSGCGDECLNRMLNIECLQGTCPCGDLCSNQQFQKRKYAKMQWRPCGKKGYGLELLEHIPKGKFIIEYVGEVLDMQAYEARQKDYAANGHKHFYFMTLNGSEVIDACVKGNMGRFINHSCDPNCRTEKWMVNGEICIGLFAMRDIKEGEELTFDYNYVRVFGAAAKKCHCGSQQCRGYIGGDPLNNEIIYQGDSDEEYPEPLMLEDGGTGYGFRTISRTRSFYGDRTQISEAIARDTNKMDDSSRAVGQLEITGKFGNSKNQSTPAISLLHHSIKIEDSEGKFPYPQSSETSLQVDDKTSMHISSIRQEVSKEEAMMNTSYRIPKVENFSPAMISGKLFPDRSDADRKSKSDIVKDNQGFLKSRPRIKTSRISASVKKGKVNDSPLNGNKDKPVISKSHVLPFKPKKVNEGSSNGRFEAVQEKLNELLDAEGGISKRKDAPKGYLKLLLLTAASGGSGTGDFIQSNRDLSMILDALLKTKSRVVLMDIINKNGLQMLHNMIKQYSDDFKKIPILRKLLKVLEYLAVREILTRNQIIAGPPCPGMESFRGSILSLTEHDDKQVHQIARSFRDRWIPKHFRKQSNMDRDGGGMDVHRDASCNRLPMLHNHRHDQGLRPSEAIDCVIQSLVATTSVDTAANEAGSSPGTGGCQTDGSKTRKRKSRWDQPAKTNLESKHKELKLESGVLQSRVDINCPDQSRINCKKDEAVSSENGQTTQEDVPPGFSSPFNLPLVSSDASSITDLPQQSVPHLGCAFDVAIAWPQGKFNSRLPVSYGIPLHILQQFGSPLAETVDGWVIAPGMPFQPFPPLPRAPRCKKETTAACKKETTFNGSAEEWQLDSNHPPNCCPDENNPSTTGTNQSDADIAGTDTQHTLKRMRGPSNDLGKRYFRQQKRIPPWLWRRKEPRNSFCSQDISCREDKPVSNFHQRPPQQNHH